MHLTLATAGLLTWVAYLITDVAWAAWADCALLLPVAGLGITLVFLSPPASPAESVATAQAAPDGTPDVPARRPPVLAVGAHIAFATATILFAFLTAVGAG